MIRSDFTSEEHNGVIVVRDRNSGGTSVTNDAENVVPHVVRLFGDRPIVYQDSDGRYDQLVHNSGAFQTFRSLDTRYEVEAIARAKSEASQ